MNLPKFKMTKNEMLEFNDQCESVSSLGPGTLSQYEDRQILLGEVKPKQLVEYWIQDLWLKHNLNSVRKCPNAIRLGIAKDADAVKLIFKKYKEYKTLKAIQKRERKANAQQTSDLPPSTL